MLIYHFVKGRGTVATGRVEQGTIKVGEEVEIMGLMQVKCGICWIFSSEELLRYWLLNINLLLLGFEKNYCYWC